MGQESRNREQILYGDLILTLDLSNLPRQRFSHPCQDHCGLGIFPGWLSSTQSSKDSILRLYNFSTQLSQTLPKGKREMGKHTAFQLSLPGSLSLAFKTHWPELVTWLQPNRRGGWKGSGSACLFCEQLLPLS